MTKIGKTYEFKQNEFHYTFKIIGENKKSYDIIVLDTYELFRLKKDELPKCKMIS